MKSLKFGFGDRVVHTLTGATGKVSHHCGRGLYMVTWHSDMRTGRIHGRFIRCENILDEIVKATA